MIAADECPECGTPLIGKLIVVTNGNRTEHRYCPSCDDWHPKPPGDWAPRRWKKGKSYVG